MKNLIPKIKRFVKRNKATILTTFGSAGVVITGVVVAKDTIKSTEAIKKEEEAKGEKLTTSEKISIAAPKYIPSVISGAGTIACIVGSNNINKKDIVALQGAYMMLDQTFKEYKDTVKDVCGEDTYQEIDGKVAKAHIKIDDVIVEEDELLFYDEYSKRKFSATMLEIIDAEKLINKQYVKNGHINMNDLYSYFGLNWEPKYDDVGFNVWAFEDGCDKKPEDFAFIDFEHTKETLDDGLEFIVISFSMRPRTDYLDF